MIRILANDSIAESAIEKLENNGFEVVRQHFDKDALVEQVKEFDAMIVRSATKVRKEIIDSAVEAGRLSLILRAGVGLDNIDVEYAEEHGITVQNTPNASTDAVAELAIAHIFAAARNIHISNVTMRNMEWNKKQYKGFELKGKILGLIGFGRIGQSVAEKAHSLGMSVIYNTRSGDKGFKDFKHVEMDELLKTADIISLHVPYVKGRGAVLDKEEFNKMKKGVLIVNTARGGVVSEDALLEAIDKDIVCCAALDVYEEEPNDHKKLANNDSISLTPHIGASTFEAQDRIGEEICEVIFNHFENKGDK